MNPFIRNFFSAYVFVIAAMISANGQSIVLPDFSNVYPDTFAIYWQRPEKTNVVKGDYAIQVKCTSLYDDLVFETEQSEDSIISVPFIPEHADEQAMLVCPSFFKNDERIIDRLSRSIELRVLPQSDKIEALKSLVNTNASIENLKLLADAFEEDKCFANAFHVYRRMILADAIHGRKHLLDFYKRNYKILTPVRNSVAR